jgi:hypothetical protein
MSAAAAGCNGCAVVARKTGAYTGGDAIAPQWPVRVTALHEWRSVEGFLRKPD